MIPYFTYVANVLMNRTTAYSPYFLMFGRHPKVSTSQLYLSSMYDEEECEVEINEFVRSQMKTYQRIFNDARRNLRGSILKHQELYNQKVKTFEIGDLVLVYHPKLGQSGSKFHNFWSGPYRISKKINSVTYEVEMNKPGGRRWNPALTLDRLRKYYSRSSLGELDEILDEAEEWDDDDEDNIIVDIEEENELSSSPMEDPLLEVEEDAEELKKPGKRTRTRVQPDRAVKITKLKSYSRIFNQEKQAYYLFPPQNSKNNTIYRLSVSQILMTKNIRQSKELYNNPQAVDVRINSKGVQTIMDRVATLTKSFFQRNSDHYRGELPYHKVPKICDAARELFEH